MNRDTPRVVVTGRGVVCSLADDPTAFHQALVGPTNPTEEPVVPPLGPRPVDPPQDSQAAQALDTFDAGNYLQGRSLRPLDRTGRLATVAAQLALVDSGWVRDSATDAASETPPIGLVLGTLYGSVHTITRFDQRVVRDGPIYAKPFDFANSVINAAAGQAAIWHGLRGVNSTVAGGPTAGLQALAYASDLIRAGRASVVVAGGAEELSPEALDAFARAGLLADSAERPIPFGSRRNGFALTEGAAFFVLEDARLAQRRGATVHAEILGHGNGFDPSRGVDAFILASTVARTGRQCLDDAGLSPDAIDALSVSANGSQRGDAAEARGLADLLGARVADVPVTAVKGRLGEALGASGALQALALVESARTGVLPGIAGLDTLEDDFPLPTAGAASRSVDLAHGLVSAVGFDGNVCALALGRGAQEVLG